MDALFAYGTLLFAPVVRAVVGRELRASEATLEGFVRRCVVDEVFPALLECAGERVDGLLYDALEPQDWRRLDAYEGELYVKRRVVVQLVSGGDRRRSTTTGELSRDAFLYVPRRESLVRVSAEPWAPAAFARDHLAAFAGRLARATVPRAQPRSTDHPEDST